MRTHQQRIDKILARALDEFLRDHITLKELNRTHRDIDKLAARAITAAERDEILADANGRCEYCKTMNATVVDHVIPVHAGGTSDRDNLKAACRPCNTDKLDLTLAEWEAAVVAEGRAWPPDWWAELRADMERVAPGDPRNEMLTRRPSNPWRVEPDSSGPVSPEPAS